jgi:hypothetical protein
MKSFLPTLALLPAIMLAEPAAAQVTGSWQVSGKVGSTAFLTNCQFTPNSNGFGGVCVESKTGKHHVLAKGSINGSKVQWSYPASFMMMTFDVNFAGTLSGNSITGTVAASGHDGIFTATRSTSPSP